MHLEDKEYLAKLFETNLNNEILDYLLKNHQDFLKALRLYHKFSKEKRQLSVYIGNEYVSIKNYLKREFNVELPQKFLSLNKLEKLNQ